MKFPSTTRTSFAAVALAIVGTIRLLNSESDSIVVVGTVDSKTPAFNFWCLDTSKLLAIWEVEKWSALLIHKQQVTGSMPSAAGSN